MTKDERMESELRRALDNGRGTTPCPGEGTLVAFYRGGLSEAADDAVREHLAGCASCVELARDARAFVGAMEESAVEGTPLSRAARWLAAAAALAVVLLAGIWLTRSAPVAPVHETRAETPVATEPNPWKDLPVAAAAYPAAPEDELVFRSDDPDTSGFREAMAPYVRGDYAAAETGLARFLTSHPGDTSGGFYRGVSLLLLGRPEEAVPFLEAAAGSPASPDEARWYLALAQLKSGNEAAALRELDEVAGAAGPHRLEAVRLAEEVRGVVGHR